MFGAERSIARVDASALPPLRHLSLALTTGCSASATPGAGSISPAALQLLSHFTALETLALDHRAIDALALQGLARNLSRLKSLSLNHSMPARWRAEGLRGQQALAPK